MSKVSHFRWKCKHVYPDSTLCFGPGTRSKCLRSECPHLNITMITQSQTRILTIILCLTTAVALNLTSTLTLTVSSVTLILVSFSWGHSVLGHLSGHLRSRRSFPGLFDSCFIQRSSQFNRVRTCFFVPI